MTAETAPIVYSTEIVPLDSLTAHPQNYRAHPAEQRAHLTRSIRAHGFYRNVVVARDGTILAGHGVVEAAADAGLDVVPVVRLDLDPNDPEALKVLTGDNEIARLALIDDSRLAALLASVKETSADSLLGTGFGDAALAALLAKLTPEAPGEFPPLDPDDLAIEHRCPSCGYEWSGSPSP